MKTLAVQRWPGPAPTPQDGLFAILIITAEPQARQLPAGEQRDAARRHLRSAACEALAAVLRIPAGDIAIASNSGEPPSILLDGRPSAIGISLSHDGGYSVAAINLQGAIGVDIMRHQDIPDWQTVAQDYLGPAVASGLRATPATERPHAFAQAWTQREAALKCHAQHLGEWQADLPGRSIALSLPVDGLSGHIHIGDNNA